jgi:hypothetical protein
LITRYLKTQALRVQTFIALLSYIIAVLCCGNCLQPLCAARDFVVVSTDPASATTRYVYQPLRLHLPSDSSRSSPTASTTRSRVPLKNFKTRSNELKYHRPKTDQNNPPKCQMVMKEGCTRITLELIYRVGIDSLKRF